MLGFPKPYPEELIYSTVARAGVHDGDTSPKQLLEKVFNNRKVIATVDLPSHLELIANLYPKSLTLDAYRLIHQHTLLPIYAPFQPEEQNDKLLNWMSGCSQGAAHLACGAVASRVKAKTALYVCPECLEDQKRVFGEYYLRRIWQTPLVKVCLVHGPLYETTMELNGEHRHAFLPLESIEIKSALVICREDIILAQQAEKLLKMDSSGVNFPQWSEFYKQLAVNLDLMNGQRIDHSLIHSLIVKYWTKPWLDDSGILPSSTETSWLRTLFRKHRKSFSYAEHSVAILALTDGKLNIDEAIKAASKIVPRAEINVQDCQADCFSCNNEFSDDQLKWKSIVEKFTLKIARKQDAALYARLYRADRAWLLRINAEHQAERVVSNLRVDWSRRDRDIAREIHSLFIFLAEDLDSPQLTRTFIINQLDQRATVEKNLCRLPRCSTLLRYYAESTTEYQARRLIRAFVAMQNNKQKIKRWSLLREARLSDIRMTYSVAELLKGILND
ncbi:TnsD family Tn7-like transposition protein [Marinomonas foliarum]|uniref:Tn7-like transposition protein D n=1 Tax=Marinomonas foliarum TaxID=491950 RepID=A0A368ZMP9_9GAMM|nr:TnsD family Tn7-like transposition protein [Marinomonas foliarum]RCW96332.1 Tn7-like transposition protein D [Marinomonas foliarum]